MKKRFDAIKKFLALENDTEICRTVINDFYFRNQEKLQPTLRYFLTNPSGVLIVDLELNQLIQISLTPDKPPYCPHFKTNNCKHTQFALTTPAIKNTSNSNNMNKSESSQTQKNNMIPTQKCQKA